MNVELIKEMLEALKLASIRASGGHQFSKKESDNLKDLINKVQQAINEEN